MYMNMHTYHNKNVCTYNCTFLNSCLIQYKVHSLSPSSSLSFLFPPHLQVIIPVSLYVSIEVVKFVQVYFINWDLDMYYEAGDRPFQCRALNINEDLGQIQYVFSDKTGTLTENEMVFRCCSVGGKNYPHTGRYMYMYYCFIYIHCTYICTCTVHSSFNSS